jgi:hypothetical protein
VTSRLNVAGGTIGGFRTLELTGDISDGNGAGSLTKKGDANVTRSDDPRRVGDMWAFVALDPETKLVPTYRVESQLAEARLRSLAISLSD